jgi:hypothetical protein
MEKAEESHKVGKKSEDKVKAGAKLKSGEIVCHMAVFNVV